MGIYPSSLISTPFIYGDKRYIAVLYIYRGLGNDKCKLRLYSAKGNLIREKLLKDHNSNYKNAQLIALDKNTRDRLYLIYEDGEINEIDTNLNIISKLNVKYVQNGIFPANMAFMILIMITGKRSFLVGQTGNN